MAELGNNNILVFLILSFQSFGFLPITNQVIDKKKLSRTSNSKHVYGFKLSHEQQGILSKINEEKNLNTKFQGLKKSVSAKLSLFHVTKVFDL